MNGVLVAMLLDPLGHAHTDEVDVVAERDRFTGRNFDVRIRHDAWASPPAELRSVQPGWIPLRLGGHSGPTIGFAQHLHRSKSTALYAVFSTIPSCPELVDNEFYVSAEIDAAKGEHGIHVDLRLDGAAIVQRSAQVGLTPARYIAGKIDSYEVRTARLPELERHILDCALITYKRRRGLRDDNPLTVWDDLTPGQVLARRQPEGLTELELRQIDREDELRHRYSSSPGPPAAVVDRTMPRYLDQRRGWMVPPKWSCPNCGRPWAPKAGARTCLACRPGA